LKLPGRFSWGDDRERDQKLQSLQRKFAYFLALLAKNNEVLKRISDMEESSNDSHVVDIEYVKENVSTIRVDIREIINNMVAIGGDQYKSLYDRYRAIDQQVQHDMPGFQGIREDSFTIDYSEIGSERAPSVGSKNAQLGEMKTRLGLPVPDGFAISAWAYQYFVKENHLQARIDKLMERLDMESYQQLSAVSDQIRDLIRSSPVPPDLAESIKQSCRDLRTRTGSERFSMRSSAIGEDSFLSFAGQYATFLNVRCREFVDRYRDILASKFTPKAIYYLLSHSLFESDLAMSVGCIEMVNAFASGVAYSRNPLDPDDGNVIVNSIYGLGRHLVDGTQNPDEFIISKTTGTISEVQISEKPTRLVIREEGGTADEPVPREDQNLPSVNGAALQLLTEYAIVLERHYGSPQDIEWAIDTDGRLYILQTRPLRVIRKRRRDAPMADSRKDYRICAGTTVCPGAGSGPVFMAIAPKDLENMPEGSVLVTPRPFPGMITAMQRASAIVTKVGGIASHIATLAREYRLPTIVSGDCMEKVEQGTEITVDATEGVVYEGRLDDVVRMRTRSTRRNVDQDTTQMLDRIMQKISPLNLLNPADEDFQPSGCRTFHDIIRFAHQSAIKEMFAAAESLVGKQRLGLQLVTPIPVDMNIIFIDDTYKKFKNRKKIREKDLTSIPMAAFWSGVNKEGWPSANKARITGAKFGTALESQKKERDTEFSVSSFAILTKEYMISGLHMGYHFSTVEAMVSDEISRNFIRMQYKEGGAALDRRIRRVKLLSDILGVLGFDIGSKGDFFQSSISYLSRKDALDKLYILGRLAILTKQLDMALLNDDLAEWYTRYFKKKLGILVEEDEEL